MPFKVKEHFRKTKKGLTRVKESTRKDKIKKGLLVAGAALTTLGLGALAYKKLGSKLVKGAVNISSKADDVTANKAKNITKLLTPSKYKTLPDPWLDNVVPSLRDEAVTVNKSTKALTTGKKKTKLLTGSRQQSEIIPDPWNDAVIKGTDKPLTVSKLKEKPLLLKSGYNAPTKPKVISIKRNKDLGGEIRSQRTLIGREPKDISNANKQLELAKRYEVSDSPAYRRTGASYRKRANERLTIIAERSPSKKQTGLVTTRGKASQATNRSSNYKPKTREKKTELTVTKSANTNEGGKLKPEPPISEVTRIPNQTTKQAKKKTRRELLTGGKSAQDLAENFIDSGIKGAINKAGDNVADILIPGSSQVGKTIRDVKGRVRQVEKLSNELAENGNKKSSRRGFLKKAVNKIAEEGSLKPRDAENIASGIAKKTRVTIRKASSTGTATPEVNYTTDSRFPVQGGVKISKRVYRQPRGLLERMGQRLRKAARYKSGNYDTRYD